jgi:predicted DNA-binding WGR domain protein
MPLFELEEGTTRKFYRIELEGTAVRLTWGRIGTRGESKLVTQPSTAEAQAEYDRQVLKRKERGYRLVVDERAPHDPQATQKKHVAGRTPVKTARFLFTHRKKGQFVWLEVRGDALLVAEGPLGEEPHVAPRTDRCADAAAAVKKRDGLMAHYLAQGYQLAAAAGAAEKPRREKRQLHRNAALEGAVRENLDDEGRWRVLEDWLLERGGWQGELVAADRSGSVNDAAEARGRGMELLLGPRHAALSKAVSEPQWRAGFLRRAHFDPGSSSRVNRLELFEAFLQAPAAALIEQLGLTLHSTEEVEAHLSALTSTRAALRSLKLVFSLHLPAPVDGAWLAPFEGLKSLTLIGPFELTGTDPLPALSELSICPRPLDIGALERLFSNPFPSLRALQLTFWDTGPLERLAPLLEKLPLNRLTLRGDARATAPLMNTLSRGPLAALLGSP